MGKAQKKKAMRRHNPVRVPDSHLPHGLATASESSSKANEILPIIQKVRSFLPHPFGVSWTGDLTDALSTLDARSRCWRTQVGLCCGVKFDPERPFDPEIAAGPERRWGSHRALDG